MFFDHVWNRADGLLFLKGRLYFHHVTGERARANSGAPSVLAAYGRSNAESLRQSGISGAWVGAKEIVEAPKTIAQQRQPAMLNAAQRASGANRNVTL